MTCFHDGSVSRRALRRASCAGVLLCAVLLPRLAAGQRIQEPAWHGLAGLGLARLSLDAGTLTTADEETFLTTDDVTCLTLGLGIDTTIQPGLDGCLALEIFSGIDGEAPADDVEVVLLTLGLSWRPLGRVWFVRGGAGAAMLRPTILERGSPDRRTLFGFGFSSATGLEFELSERISALLSLDYAFMSTEEFGASASLFGWTVGGRRRF